MSEARFEDVVRELRASAPPAPDTLRERVRGLREPGPRLVPRLRPALVAAVGIAIAVGLGAAAIGGLRSSPTRQERVLAPLQERAPGRASAGPSAPGAVAGSSSSRRLGAEALTIPSPGFRLQRYDVAIGLRVRDLSQATQAAIRRTRKLGGYIAAADYATDPRAGSSRLDLRVPVRNVQAAIAHFTQLGTILSQHISVADLQASVDRIDRRLAAARKTIAELQAKSSLTPAERAQLDAAKRMVKRLTRSRSGLVREGTYARVSLELTTRKPAAKHTEPGRFGRFWDSAGDILGKELVAVLYALVVAGPFVLLAALALLAERARRRRADHRLLEETG